MGDLWACQNPHRQKSPGVATGRLEKDTSNGPQSLVMAVSSDLEERRKSKLPSRYGA